jgi:hypothetical protein
MSAAENIPWRHGSIRGGPSVRIVRGGGAKEAGRISGAEGESKSRAR